MKLHSVFSLALTAFTLSTPAIFAQTHENLPPLYIERILTLQKGETLSQTLTRAGMPSKQAHRIIAPLQKKVSMKRFKPGQKVSLIYIESNPHKIGTIEHVSFHTEKDQTAIVAPNEQGQLIAKLKKRPLTQTRAVAVGEILGSLYQSAKVADLPASLVPAFANLFAYELDFTRDIRKGDQFKVIFEEIKDENGDFLRTGKILAAELVARGKRRSAFLYKDQHGRTEYYDEKGNPKRKLLLRTPLEFTRISSHYNLKRMHPVLGYTRAHRGTDFAAPTGTPVKAAGNGVVERANWFGAYGKYVRIRHNSKYKSAYAHLHRIARGMKPGKRVRQGQIIGYVGSTGRSTGPHLHYEVHVHNKKVNPMRAKLPAGNPLPRKKLAGFKSMVAEYKSMWQKEKQEQLVRMAKTAQQTL